VDRGVCSFLLLFLVLDAKFIENSLPPVLMKPRERDKEEKWFPRMRPYIIRYLIRTGVAAFVVALCVGLLVYDGAAQVDAAVDKDILTVRQCIHASASVDPLEEALIKEDIIEEDLLHTNVTNVMCKDMLEPIHDGTPVRRLVTAQNYMQEIKLIEEAMRRASGEAAAKGTDAKGTDRHFVADEPLVLPRWTLLGATQIAQVDQYDGDDPVPSSPSPEPGPPPPGGVGGAAPGGGGRPDP
jgi:hypothetical protein